MFQNILNTSFIGNRLREYLLWLLVLCIGLLIIFVFKKVILVRLKKWSEKTETKIDDFIVLHVQKTLTPLLYWGVFALSIRYLALPAIVIKGISFAWAFLATFLAARFLVEALDFGVHDYLMKKGTAEDKIKGIKAILIFVKLAVIGFAVFILLDNLGIKISALIAGLGVGGIAVALAAQAFLGDIFSFITILFDKPFEPGDFIVFGNESGTVENIGIKTTRIRSLSGEQIVVSNTSLTSSLIHNYKRMNQRRVVLSLGVIYQTPSKQLKEIPILIENII